MKFPGFLRMVPKWNANGMQGIDSNLHGEPEFWLRTPNLGFGELNAFTCNRCGHFVEVKAQRAVDRSE
jgi:hypothetical protein